MPVPVRDSLLYALSLLCIVLTCSVYLDLKAEMEGMCENIYKKDSTPHDSDCIGAQEEQHEETSGSREIRITITT